MSVLRKEANEALVKKMETGTQVIRKNYKGDIGITVNDV
jgi:hypothetical protein